MGGQDWSWWWAAQRPSSHCRSCHLHPPATHWLWESQSHMTSAVWGRGRSDSWENVGPWQSNYHSNRWRWWRRGGEVLKGRRSWGWAWGGPRCQQSVVPSQPRQWRCSCGRRNNNAFSAKAVPLVLFRICDRERGRKKLCEKLWWERREPYTGLIFTTTASNLSSPVMYTQSVLLILLSL